MEEISIMQKSTKFERIENNNSEVVLNFSFKSLLQIIYGNKFEFLRYLEGCIEDTPKLNFQELLENLTRDHDDHVIMNKAGLHSSGEISKFYNFTKWNESKENVIYNHFDPTYGQCFTIDISPLIGKAGPNDIENKMSLILYTKPYQNNSFLNI